jgi:hypothetical protein
MLTMSSTQNLRELEVKADREVARAAIQHTVMKNVGPPLRGVIGDDV